MNIIFLKQRGSLLIDLLLGTSLASMMFLMLYQAYNSINKSTRAIKNTAIIESERSVFAHHMYQDVLSISFPVDIETFYTSINVLIKNEKQHDAVQKEDSSSTSDKKDKEEKEKKRQEKIFNSFLHYIPRLEKKENNISLSFVSTRQLLSSQLHDKESLITYSFEKIKMLGNNHSVFVLKRYEKLFNGKDKKQPHGYTLLSCVEDPDITLIRGVMPAKKQDESESQQKNKNEQNKEEQKGLKKEEKKTCFQEWKENPHFETVQELNSKTPEECIKYSMPYAIVIQGLLLSQDGKKRIPFTYVFSVPIAEFQCSVNCDYEELLKQYKEEAAKVKSTLEKTESKLEHNPSQEPSENH